MDSVDSIATTCPSAQPEHPEAKIIGVLREQNSRAFIEPLPRALAPDTFIDLIPANVRPTEVLRFSAPCAEQRCTHFHLGSCQLAKRIVSDLPEASAHLKPCAIRQTCRWFRQEGPAACRRCPQVVTEPYTTTGLMREVAQPATKGDENVNAA